MKRTALSAAAALILVPLLATAASAAPAPNDTAATATVVSALPSTIEQDTTGATTDATDAALNAQCGAPFTNASVWFRYTASADGGVIADMSASSYTGGFLVTEGDPAGGNLIACGPTTVGFATTAGQTYYVVAFSDTATQGGNLVVTFDNAPPPPEATVTVNPRGVANKDGSATLSGTYSCSNADDFFSDIEGSLTQQVGRVKINGSFFVNPIQCDRATHSWSGTAFTDNGVFKGGKGANVTFAFACGTFECAVGYTEQTVQLSGAKK
ncbi:DUF6299 family protein [Pedococcus bigeumensis]|uniref:DUF6299 domain-containing protein n=1 Tax=Pedococcus bigeumensis TaxID=433644 RepID=A0A502D2K0_9MICO|nr:DUF6299 family protein [Pedococcus bigeumensis]TPG18316.1 hypothetical protein EAH86_08090 [Pedococcus bigeumensis]